VVIREIRGLFYICLHAYVAAEFWAAESPERCENEYNLVVEPRVPLPAPPREPGCNAVSIFRL